MAQGEVMPTLQSSDNGVGDFLKLLMGTNVFGSGTTTATSSTSAPANVDLTNSNALLAQITKGADPETIDNIIKNIFDEAKVSFGPNISNSLATGNRALTDTTLADLQSRAIGKATANAAAAKLQAITQSQQTAATVVNQQTAAQTQAAIANAAAAKTTTTSTAASPVGKALGGLGTALALPGLLNKAAGIPDTLATLKKKLLPGDSTNTPPGLSEFAKNLFGNSAAGGASFGAPGGEYLSSLFGSSPESLAVTGGVGQQIAATNATQLADLVGPDIANLFSVNQAPLSFAESGGTLMQNAAAAANTAPEVAAPIAEAVAPAVTTPIAEAVAPVAEPLAGSTATEAAASATDPALADLASQLGLAPNAGATELLDAALGTNALSTGAEVPTLVNNAADLTEALSGGTEAATHALPSAAEAIDAFGTLGVPQGYLDAIHNGWSNMLDMHGLVDPGGGQVVNGLGLSENAYTIQTMNQLGFGSESIQGWLDAQGISGNAANFADYGAVGFRDLQLMSDALGGLDQGSALTFSETFAEGGVEGLSALAGGEAFAGLEFGAAGAEGIGIAEGAAAGMEAFAGLEAAGAAAASGEVAVAMGEMAVEMAAMSAVICTELHRGGEIPIEKYYNNAAAFAGGKRIIHPMVKKGYHFWGIPYVQLMRKYSICRKLILPLAQSRIDHINGKTNFLGFLSVVVGEPICYVIGKTLQIIEITKPWLKPLMN